MTSAQQTYQRMGLEQLRQRAIQTDEHDDDEAARAFVDRLLDLEVERRLVLLHERPGWHACSPGFGDGTGKGTAPTDSMYLAYIKGIRISPWHDTAKRAVSALPERQRLAVLIRTVKQDYRKNNKWAAKYDEIATSIGSYAQELGWPPGVVALNWYANGRSIRKAALEARVELILLAKGGVI